jgi:hypothetical protein
MKYLKKYKLFEFNSSDRIRTHCTYKIFENSKVNTITLYHGSPYKFDKFKSQDELGYNHSGHILSGISFTDDINKAIAFSYSYPLGYYEDLKSLSNSFTNIDKILQKVKHKDTLDKIGSIEKIENHIKKVKETLLSSWERFKDLYDWLDERKQWDRFEEQNKYSIRELEILRSKLKQANHLSQYSISDSEQLELDKYNKELQNLNRRYDNDYGFVYTVEVTYDEFFVVEGEDIGFGSHREEVINNLDKDCILKINDADTGKYIGTEFIVPDESINNIKIIKRDKSN